VSYGSLNEIGKITTYKNQLMKKLTESTTVVTALKRREWGVILQWVFQYSMFQYSMAKKF
jgi:hypothetical protein